MLMDLTNAKDLGFNVARHHVKVNEPAYYHLADKLGLMIWYDLPNAGWHSLGEEAEELFEELLRNALGRDHNHPSIVIWNIFNESWGINERPFQDPIPAEAFPYVRRMVDITRELDSSRLLVDNSACCQNGHIDTDLNDFHYYLDSYEALKNLLDGIAPQIQPGSTWNFNDGAQSGQPWLNSEFSTRGGQFPHQVSLFRAYPKLNGYVGVQLTETEQEIHSPFRYDRQPNDPEFMDHHGNPRTARDVPRGRRRVPDGQVGTHRRARRHDRRAGANQPLQRRRPVDRRTAVEGRRIRRRRQLDRRRFRRRFTSGLTDAVHRDRRRHCVGDHA
jgi:hypothetical protein